MTHEQFGEKVGVSNKTISRWKTGNYMPPVECLNILSDIYNISFKDIILVLLVVAFIANTLNLVALGAKKESMKL